MFETRTSNGFTGSGLGDPSAFQVVNANVARYFSSEIGVHGLRGETDAILSLLRCKGNGPLVDEEASALAFANANDLRFACCYFLAHPRDSHSPSLSWI